MAVSGLSDCRWIIRKFTLSFTTGPSRAPEPTRRNPYCSRRPRRPTRGAPAPSGVRGAVHRAARMVPWVRRRLYNSRTISGAPSAAVSLALALTRETRYRKCVVLLRAQVISASLARSEPVWRRLEHGLTAVRLHGEDLERGRGSRMQGLRAALEQPHEWLRAARLGNL